MPPSQSVAQPAIDHLPKDNGQRMVGEGTSSSQALAAGDSLIPSFSMRR